MCMCLSRHQLATVAPPQSETRLITPMACAQPKHPAVDQLGASMAHGGLRMLRSSAQPYAAYSDTLHLLGAGVSLWGAGCYKGVRSTTELYFPDDWLCV
jgi:hypothetical protein